MSARRDLTRAIGHRVALVCGDGERIVGVVERIDDRDDVIDYDDRARVFGPVVHVLLDGFAHAVVEAVDLTRVRRVERLTGGMA
mgnify:CR=1 FL=1